MRLDAWLAGAVADLSRSRAKALIVDGSVAIGGATIVEPKRPVKPGECVTIDLPPPVPAEPEPESIPLDVVYEDNDLIVIDKPPGLVVHPAAGNQTGTLVNALIAHCGASLSGIGGVMRPGIVHRLDKDTSGLMVVAKTDRAHRGLAAQFADHLTPVINLGLIAYAGTATLLVSPTTAGQAGRSGANGTIDGVEDVNWVRFTYPFNMTRHPAATVCAGLTGDGMPVGLQLVGGHLDDVGVLRGAAALEDLLGGAHRRAPFPVG